MNETVELMLERLVEEYAIAYSLMRIVEKQIRASIEFRRKKEKIKEKIGGERKDEGKAVLMVQARRERGANTGAKFVEEWGETGVSKVDNPAS